MSCIILVTRLMYTAIVNMIMNDPWYATVYVVQAVYIKWVRKTWWLLYRPVVLLLQRLITSKTSKAL